MICYLLCSLLILCSLLVSVVFLLIPALWIKPKVMRNTKAPLASSFATVVPVVTFASRLSPRSLLSLSFFLAFFQSEWFLLSIGCPALSHRSRRSTISELERFVVGLLGFFSFALLLNTVAIRASVVGVVVVVSSDSIR